MQRTASLRTLVVCLLVVSADAGAQSLTGTWLATVSEVSNTCGEPLGPPDETVMEIVHAGDLIAATTGSPGETEISGVVTGESVAIGFEVFGNDGVTIYDPAANQLAITAGGTVLSGDLAWQSFGPLACFGTQTWDAVKQEAATPGDLSGDWILRATEATESCGPVDPNALDIPILIQQEGDLVRIHSDVELGQTRFAGRISGTTLHLGIALRQAGFTVFDGGGSPLAIEPDFGAFAGIATWASFPTATCTGVNSFVATIPEPEASLGLLAAAASLTSLQRRSRIRS